jgi:hypothetical protein
MDNVLKVVSKENDFKCHYNPKQQIIVEVANNDDFIKFQSWLRNLNNYVYYNSLILSSYSLFEYSLILICYYIDKYIDPTKKFKEPRKDIFKSCVQYIISTIPIHFEDEELQVCYQEIDNVRKLRNLIAHHNGSLDNKKQEEFSFVTKDKRLVIIDNKQVYIDDSAFIREFTSISKKFLDLILVATKNHMNVE